VARDARVELGGHAEETVRFVAALVDAPRELGRERRVGVERAQLVEEDRRRGRRAALDLEGDEREQTAAQPLTRELVAGPDLERMGEAEATLGRDAGNPGVVRAHGLRLGLERRERVVRLARELERAPVLEVIGDRA